MNMIWCVLCALVLLYVCYTHRSFVDDCYYMFSGVSIFLPVAVLEM